MRISDWSSDVCSSDLIGNVQASPFFRQQGLAARLQTLRHFARNPVYRLHEARLPKRPYKWVGIGSRQHLHGTRRKPGRVPIVLQSPFFKKVMETRTKPGDRNRCESGRRWSEQEISARRTHLKTNKNK